ncbi:MAG: hypothetical protein Q7T44_08270 [Parvibaculum sp.]|nr:hypothetical protein [Parvibaculum sp.]
MGTQIQASRIQLDRAIQLYLDEKDYISACTLAGASEGIAGEALTKAGHENALVSNVKGLHQLILDKEKETISKGEKESERAIWNDFILIRNWLKHYYPNKPELTFHAKGEAYDAIDRAITNYLQLTGTESLQMKRFTEYQSNEND